MIRSLRVQSLINEEYGFLDHHKRNADFLEYFSRKSIKRCEKNYMAFKHFEKWCGGKCTFGELTREFGERYMEYLMTRACTLKPRYERLAANTASSYFGAFKLVLREAYQERMLRENIADMLGNIPKRDTHKEFLTLDEVKLLVATPCKHDVLKRAALFSCLTGLRISDILKLRWEEIERASDDGWWTSQHRNWTIADWAYECVWAGVHRGSALDVPFDIYLSKSKKIEDFSFEDYTF